MAHEKGDRSRTVNLRSAVTLAETCRDRRGAVCSGGEHLQVQRGRESM